MGKELVKTTAIITLINVIRNEIEHGKQNIENTIENQKTITYWNIGKHIHQHLLKYNDRAEYGENLFKLISQELNIGTSTLYRAVLFYETYPNILAPAPKLTWSHYRILITVKDEEKRKEFEQLVINEGLSKRELKELVKQYRKDTGKEKSLKLPEKRGLPYYYKLKPVTEDENTRLYIDLGFRTYINKRNKRITYNENDIVQIKKAGNRYNITITNEIPLIMLFTYKGTVKDIIDADTLWVTLDIGFKLRSTQKVRLRGINAESIETEAGIKAKEFVTNK